MHEPQPPQPPQPEQERQDYSKCSPASVAIGMEIADGLQKNNNSLCFNELHAILNAEINRFGETKLTIDEIRERKKSIGEFTRKPFSRKLKNIDGPYIFQKQIKLEKMQIQLELSKDTISSYSAIESKEGCV